MTVTQVYKGLATFFGILAAIILFFLLRLRWTHAADFDVTGFLWFVTNLGPLSLLFLFLVCVGIAMSYWIRSWRGG